MKQETCDGECAPHSGKIIRVDEGIDGGIGMNDGQGIWE